ncbi:MAG: hypothetical protein ABUS79_07815 [Pseudomonadota bacterium]
MNVGRAALPVAWLWLAVCAPPAAAQEPASLASGHVELEVQGCPAVPIAAIRRVVGIEIGDLLLAASATGQRRDVDRLTIRCAGNFASVEATGISGGGPTERIVRLDDFPGDAAPRALALLGVELLAARSATVRARILGPHKLEPAPAAETAAPSPASPSRAVAERQLRIGVDGVWRTFVTQDGHSAFGARVHASRPAMKHALVGGDLEFATTDKAVNDVGQTVDWLVSGAATFDVLAGGRRWRAAVGLGGRIGVVRESARSAAPARITSATFVRPWGGPMINATLSGMLGRVAWTVGAEAGWSLSSIDETAAGVTAIAVRGPWVAVSVGADLRR